MNFVILAGGSGTRLWPMSRTKQPKQLAKLVTEFTMLEDTVHRLRGLAEPKNLFISTNPTFAPMIQEILPNIPADHYIIEPDRRDTGPAMAYVATWMSRLATDEPMVFIPSDHFIRDAQVYRDTFKEAETVIRETGKLLTIVIAPTFPNPHLGYTKVGKVVEHRNGIHFYQFLGHTEKPDYETAKQFLDDGSYFWHANYYMWTPNKFIAAYQEYTPSIGSHLPAIRKAIEADDQEALARAYGQMEKISIDYAVAEKMNPDDFQVIRGDFGWADLGSWDMLYEELSHQTDVHGNLIKADWHGIDTTNTLVYGPEGKLITTIGVSDLVIVDTPDALLVTPKGRAQDVKKIVDVLKGHEREHYL